MTQQNNFDPQVIESVTLSLVQFKSEYNGACQILSMIYEDLEKSYRGTANFYTVDFEKENDLSNKYGVMEIPTILFFKSGKLVDHSIGLIPKNTLIAKIENALSNKSNA